MKRLHERHEQDTVSIDFEGQQLKVPAGESVLAAILAAGAVYNRTTPISNAHRTGYCHMGICFECLMEIDGVPNRQACMIQVRDGMKVRRQYGAMELGNE